MTSAVQTMDSFGVFDPHLGVDAWFAANMPDCEKDEDFVAMRQAEPEASRIALMEHFGAVQWIERNRTNYRQLVTSVLSSIQARKAAHDE